MLVNLTIFVDAGKLLSLVSHHLEARFRRSAWVETPHQTATTLYEQTIPTPLHARTTQSLSHSTHEAALGHDRDHTDSEFFFRTGGFVILFTELKPKNGGGDIFTIVEQA